MLLALALLQGTGGAWAPSIQPAPDPWPTPAQACGLMQSEAVVLARQQARRGGPVEVEQAVDCAARTVTRIISAGRTARLTRSAQSIADSFACMSPRNQTMYERDGWSFRVEFRGPRAAIATARVTCPPSYPFNDEPHERGMPARDR